MSWIRDGTVAHLREVTDWPDVGERYEVAGRLGRGGMGVVYAARDRVLDRDVAIKIVNDFRSPSEFHRLLAEARVLGRLEHPGIVPVHDAGHLSDGRAFYVMKLVRGQRLDEAIASLGIGDRLDLFLRVCDAVSFAHARGIVHRDLKPQNVMLGAFREVLVMDWGVATVADGRPDHLTVVGTPGFMSPEQRDGGPTDARTDIYALGVILESMLPEPVPKALVAVARRARAEQPQARYSSVEAMARDVTRFRDGDPVSAYEETALDRITRLFHRYQLPILLVLAYVMMRLALLAWRGV